MRSPSLSPWESALVIALGLHGAALALAFNSSIEEPEVSRKAFAKEDKPLELGIYFIEEPFPGGAPSGGSPDAPGSRAAAMEPRPGRVALPGSDRKAPANAPPEPAGDAPGARGSSEYDALPGRVEGLPGLGGAPAWSVPGVLAPLPRAAPAPTTIPDAPIDHDAGGRAIRGTLDARDQKRGMALPAANEAAQAIEAVVASAETRGESKATFTVELDASGNVKNVALAKTTSGDATIWAGVIAKIRAALAGRRLTMRGDAARLGAIVSIEVVTRDRFPNGARGTGATNLWGEHRSRTVLSRARVIVAGERPLPEDIKPIVIQPFFTPPDPKKSGIVPLNPADEYHRRGGE